MKIIHVRYIHFLYFHKKEIKKIHDLTTIKNLYLIPTKMYFNKRGYLKVELGVGKSKKLFDKRSDIKRRETDIEVGRAIRRNQKR